MAKVHSTYVCQQCGYESLGWLGKCPNCGTWGSLVETVVEEKSRKKGQNRSGVTKPVNLSSISSQKTRRTSTKISELDRVLGGGMVPGQVILLAGEPGIGKSTLLLQVADNLLAGKGKDLVLYVSGEESSGQIAIRAQRLGIKNKSIQVLEETDIDSAVDEARQIPNLSALVVDSIQTMETSDLSGMAGSVGQVRESAFRLVRYAKSSGVPVFIVGHITKEGTVSGPSVLMHIVDSVLWFEGDKTLALRVLRAVKNRFGSTDEVGIFTMQDKGLISEDDPEKIFISTIDAKSSGCAIASVLQGARPILVEIQSLIVPSKMAFPKRIGQGIDSRRLEVLLAVLTRRCGIPLYNFDCFVNVSGGISIKEPAADLAICLSIASSFSDKPILPKSVAVGEVGLLGEIRKVSQEEKRIKEAKRLGYKNIISRGEVRLVREAVRKYVK